MDLPLLNEIVLNIHMHTRYSDGSGSHRDIAAAALGSSLDAVIVTDHNVLASGFEGYVKNSNHKVLMLIGEEIHDQSSNPQKNHLLAIGSSQEMAVFAGDPASLIKNIRESGGLSFIAHPSDPAAPAFNESDISWIDWSVNDYTGLEIWNGLSELKTLVHTKLHGIFYAFFPGLVTRNPRLETLKKWDELLSQRRIVGIGGSDAHALHLKMGPLSRVIFPYGFHFRGINTHVVLSAPLTGQVKSDRSLIYEALASGHCFVGYDLPCSSRGFHFGGSGLEASALMGDEISAQGGVTLQVKLPSFGEIQLIKDGKILKIARRATA